MSGKARTEDLDLELYRVFSFIGTTLRIHPILAGGVTFQDGESSDIPFEEVLYEVSSAGTYCLAVGNYSGTSPRLDPATNKESSTTRTLHIAPQHRGASR